MLKRFLGMTLLLSWTMLALQAQDAVGYQRPPKAIEDLLLAKPTPGVSVSSDARWMLLSERNSYPSVEELGQPEFRVAGLRLNPNNFGPSRQNYINNFYLQDVKSGKKVNITGLPANLLAGNVSWSPTQQKIAFTHTGDRQIDLYVVDVATAKASRINKQPLNLVMGSPYTWIDDQTILYKAALQPASKAPAKPITPKGPAVQENLGKAAPSRTYQDMIKSPFDEQIFEFYATSQWIQHKNGVETKIGAPAIYASTSVSPDKQYLLQRIIQKPFSYLVPANGFNATMVITDRQGKIVKQLAKLASSETTPSGYDNVQNQPRSIEWRDDAAATVVWCEPLDEGLIKNKMDYHDVVYALSAPFTGNAQTLFKTKMRYRGTQWGNDQVALVTEGSQAKQQMRVSVYNSATGTLKDMMERNMTDAYNFPGNPVTTRNAYGREVLLLMDNNQKLLMNNTVGSSPQGDLPFLATYNLSTNQSETLWRCAPGNYEFVVDVIDPKLGVLLTRKENQTTAPNYYIKNLTRRIADQPITQFGNPYPALEGIQKEKIKYKRSDGVDLTGDLYLPKGYDPKKDAPLPVFIWAYPREFNSAADAAQVRGSKDRFTTINWGSPVFWATQGYAVLDNAEMPIVAASADKKPNDNFIEQLEMNARAAIGELARLGVGDSNRVAVGGHSYGAFMTANLLAHTNLFKAGIARSGAYNRTLTPFGFQNEERTYWEAPQLYFEMSPFSYADRIKTPILLIHGEADNNPGTFPINSERLFNAVKGHGGTVRYVSLPYESHGYAGRENILHMLWEQNQWLDKYVKQAKKGF
jgi:dipeptidyl aminopeptidase/acylaminoacyl peptidase